MRSNGKSTLILLILLAIGIVIGGVIGDLLADMVPFLSYSYPIGLDAPLHLDLSVISLVFGLKIDVNVASAIGLILAYLMYRKI